MGQCCEQSAQNRPTFTCPQNGNSGRPLTLITLKSLLTPSALEQLNPEHDYRFCDSSDCSVVYFSEQGQSFFLQDLKVPVFQKVNEPQTPICYCFGWSRQRLKNELISTGNSTAIESITAHIKAKRCGCEVNNPQGSCCLANVRDVLDNFV